MVSEPKLSVLMPVFNGERYLRESIESVLNQSFKEFEFLIIDDGSTDNSATIISSYDDPRIVRITNSKNLGLIASLNLGLATARGKYVARQDADDISVRDRFVRQIQYLDRYPEIAVIGSAYQEIDATSKSIRTIHSLTNKLDVLWHSLFQVPVAHCTSMFRRATIVDAGGYSTSYDALHVEDYELWLRLLFARHEMGNLPDVLVRKRVHAASVSATFAEIQCRNYGALFRQYLSRLTGIPSSDPVLGGIWIVESGSGISTADQARRAVSLLPFLIQRFADFFQLNATERRRLSAIANRRAANNLLSNADHQISISCPDEATRMAQCAAAISNRVFLNPAFWLTQFKLFVGERWVKRLGRLRARPMSRL